MKKKKLYLGVEKSSRGQEPSTNRGHLPKKEITNPVISQVLFQLTYCLRLTHFQLFPFIRCKRMLPK